MPWEEVHLEQFIETPAKAGELEALQAAVLPHRTPKSISQRLVNIRRERGLKLTGIEFVAGINGPDKLLAALRKADLHEYARG